MIGLTRYGRREWIVGSLILLAAVGGLLLLPGAWAWSALLPTAAWVYLLSFFRDPHRSVPDDPTAVIAPADGLVTDITPLATAEYLDGPAVRVGIFLSVFDVHVNRVPCGGIVEHLAYTAGAFHDARTAEAVELNERQAIGIRHTRPDGRSVRVLVRQIAGLIARRIVCELRVGQAVTAGERFGMIKFGSRTELILPADAGFAPAVSVGDRVWGGATILGRLT